MNNSIRILVVVSFSFLAVFASGCAVSSMKERSPADFNRPLIQPKSDGNKPKIVAFGDSLTAGFGLTENESYPYLLQQKLSSDGFSYEVVNAGVSGDTSLGGAERIEWALNNENVRILILELGANDLLRGIPPAKMKTNLDSIIRKARAKNVSVLLCGMIAPPTMGVQYQKDFTSVFPDLANEYKLRFVPFVLENIAMKKELNQADGIHPNAEGEKIMTDNIYKELKPML